MPRTNGLEKKSYAELAELRLRIDRLMVLIRRGGSGTERTRVLVGCKPRGYTQEKSQTFENKRHLLSLPLLSGVGPAARGSLFFVARSRRPRLLEVAPSTVRLPTRFL